MKYDDDLDWKEKLLMVVVAFLMLWIIFFGLNSFVSAADSISRWVTKAQIDQAEELGAIQRTTLEVVNNYGEQITWNPQQAGVMSKHIRASIRYEAMVQIDDNQGLFALAEALPSLKEKMLRELKQSILKRTENLTTDMLTYEEVIIPDTNQLQGSRNE